MGRVLPGMCRQADAMFQSSESADDQNRLALAKPEKGVGRLYRGQPW